MTSPKRTQNSKPKSEGLIATLDGVSNDLPDPEATAPLVWEFLWNDPLPPESSSLPPAAQTRKSMKKGSFVIHTTLVVSTLTFENLAFLQKFDLCFSIFQILREGL